MRTLAIQTQRNTEDIRQIQQQVNDLTIVVKDFTLKPSGGIYHDRYIFIDHGTPNEMIFHCGGSSKDGGRRITSISRVEDVKLYQNIISDLEVRQSTLSM